MRRSGWGIERERKGESEKEIAGSSGVRRGVWHPLSCLLKASFFPLLPPPHAADRRYFQRPHSAALCLLHRLLKGSQKLKPESVNRPLRLGTRWRRTTGRIKVCMFMCLFACAQLSVCMKNKKWKTGIGVNRRGTAKSAAQYVAAEETSNRFHLQLTNDFWLTSFNLTGFKIRMLQKGI